MCSRREQEEMSDLSPANDSFLTPTMRKQEEDDFAKFVAKVNEIGSIISEISAVDESTSAKGMARADKYLEKEKKKEKTDAEGNKTSYNRTVLNRSILSDGVENDYSTMSTEEFMAVVEQDATERASRKCRNDK